MALTLSEPDIVFYWVCVMLVDTTSPFDVDKGK